MNDLTFEEFSKLYNTIRGMKKWYNIVYYIHTKKRCIMCSKKIINPNIEFLFHLKESHGINPEALNSILND